MAIDLNEVPGEGSKEPLPDLNQEPDGGGGDEIHHMQEHQFHLIKEAQVHPLKGQSHYLHKEQHGGLCAIDLNSLACEGQEEECHDGNVYLTSISKESNFTMTGSLGIWMTLFRIYSMSLIIMIQTL